MAARCCEICTLLPGCYLSVLSSQNDVPPHACWLKTRDALKAPKYKPGVTSCWPAGTPIPPPPPPPPPPPAQCYKTTMISFDPKPVLSYVDGTASFAQVDTIKCAVGLLQLPSLLTCLICRLTYSPRHQFGVGKVSSLTLYPVANIYT